MTCRHPHTKHRLDGTKACTPCQQTTGFARNHEDLILRMYKRLTA